MALSAVSIAIKYPGNITGQVCSAPGYEWAPISDINHWVYAVLFGSAPATADTIITWNDQRYTSNGVIMSDMRVGHTKGVLVVTPRETRFLVHSVPVFPFKSAGNLKDTFTIPISAHVYGQSFTCVRLPFGATKNRAALTSFILHLGEMHPNMVTLAGNSLLVSFPRITPLAHPYVHRLHLVSGTGTGCARALAALTCGVFGATDKVYHVANPPNNYECIYEFLAKSFGGSCYAATWIKHPRMLPSQGVSHVTDIRTCAVAASGSQGDADCTRVYKSTSDHSKWAVSSHVPTRASPCWVWIGDLNRMESQKTRGGGGILIVGNKRLWRSFRAMCESVAVCTSTLSPSTCV